MDANPFTFERVGNTTRKMSQERYEALLLPLSGRAAPIGGARPAGLDVRA